MSSTKNTDNNSVSNNKIVIRNNLKLCDIDVQFDNNEIGIIIVVNNTKYMDKPSIPRYKLKELISWYSCTNWNWLLLKSKRAKMTKETNKVNMDVFNAADLRRLLPQSGKDTLVLKEFSLAWEKVVL